MEKEGLIKALHAKEKTAIKSKSILDEKVDIIYKSSQIQVSHSGRRSLLTVEPLFVIYLLAHTTTHQVLEQLIYTVISEQYGVQSIVRLDQSKIHCSSVATDKYSSAVVSIQKDAAYWISYFRIALYAPSAIAAFVWGNLSDKMSRKMPVVLPMVANLMLVLIAICVASYRLHLNVLFIGYFLEGLGGSTSTFFMGCYAYLGHVSSSESRTFRLTINEICIIFAYGSSYFISGHMLKSLGYVFPLKIIIVLYVACFIYTMMCLPEIEHAHNTNEQQKPSWTSLIFVYMKERTNNGRLKLLSFGAVFLCVTIGSISRVTVNMLFLQNAPFCWNAKNIGVYFASNCYMNAIGNLIVLVFLHRRLGDFKLMLLSYGSSALTMVITGLSTHEFTLYIAIFTGMAHQIGFTVLRSTLSKLVPSSEQGAVFSSLAFAELCTSLLGTLSLNMIYAATIAYFRGFAYMVAGAFYFSAFLITLWISLKIKL